MDQGPHFPVDLAVVLAINIVFAVLIYCEIKDARWEVSKQSGYPSEIEPAGKSIKNAARRLARYLV